MKRTIFLCVITLTTYFFTNGIQDKQDENGNTRLHLLTCECPSLSEEALFDKFFYEVCSDEDPTILNQEGKTAVDTARDNHCPKKFIMLLHAQSLAFKNGKKKGEFNGYNQGFSNAKNASKTK